MDARIVQRLRDVPAAVVPDLPRGEGWLIVELTGDSVAEVTATGAAACWPTPARWTRSWSPTRPRRRRSGGSARTAPGSRPAPATAARRTPAGRTPPSRSSASAPTCAASRRCSTSTGCRACPTGTSATAASTCRIDFPLRRPGPDRGRARVPGLRRGRRPPGRRARRLDVRRARRRPGPQRAAAATCTPPPSSALFERVKAVFDPDDVLNPGVLVRPGPARRRHPHRRRAAAGGRGWRWPTGTTAATSPPPSTGAPASASAAPTCRPPAGSCARPGRPPARRRTPPAAAPACCRRCSRPAGRSADWRSPEVHDALDLCLSCKGCSRDCPTGVDMASYKAEVLHQSYRRRLRPARALHAGPAAAVGRPRRPHAPAGQRGPRLPARRPAGQVVGRDGPAPRRAAVRPAHLPRSSGPTRPTSARRRTTAPPVALWVDSFTDHFAPEVALAAARVLEAAGYRVQVPGADTCCGLTWITTGQLDTARKTLAAHRRDPRPAGRRRDADRRGGALVHRRPAQRGAGAGRRRRPRSGSPPAPARWPSCSPPRPGWEPPSLAGRGGRRPAALPPRRRSWAGRPTRSCCAGAGARVTRLGGCCGLAGNWGVERGHHDVSVAIAEQQLLPAVRDLPDGRRRAGRRLLLPDPARPARRPPRACTSRSCWPTGCPERPQAAAPSRRVRAAATTRGRERRRDARRSRPRRGGTGRAENIAGSPAKAAPTSSRPRPSAARGLDRGAPGAAGAAAHAARTAARNAGRHERHRRHVRRRHDDDVGARGRAGR